MLERVRPHLPIIVTAVAVAVLTTAGPVAARAVHDAMNADKVDGKHAVGAGASVKSRSGKLVATDGDGRLPDNIIDRAPDSARLGNLPPSAFGTDVLYSNGLFSLASESWCPTAEYTPARKSYALVRVDTDAVGGPGGGNYALAAAYSVDGGAFAPATPEWYTAAGAADGRYAAMSNSGVVELDPGSTYRFAGVGFLYGGNVTGSDCKVVVQVVPVLPGTDVVPPEGAPARQLLTQR